MYQPSLNPESFLTKRLVSEGVFRKAPLRVIDGGSRGGSAGQWELYGDQLELVSFEADEKECRRLNEANAASGNGRQKHYPVALGRRKGQAVLNVARFPDSSTLLKNNDDLLHRFGMARFLEHTGSVSVDLTDVSSFFKENGMKYVDFMKLDVEGVELEVLEGAEELVADSLLGLTVEVWFHKEHVDRPLFSDIDAYLRRFGFVLFDLRELSRWKRKTQSGDGFDSCTGSGQLMFANALYLRDLPAMIHQEGWSAGEHSRLRALKLASLAELFCYTDFAIEVLQSAQKAGLLRAPEAATLVQLLEKGGVPAPSSGKQWIRRGVRGMIPPPTRRWMMRLIQGLVSEG